VAAQQFQGVQGLRALANDVTDVLAGGQMIRNGDAKYLYGGHTHVRRMSVVRYLWRQTFSVLALGICEVDLALFILKLVFCAHRSTLIMQFCQSGAGISSWDSNIAVTVVRLLR